MIALWSNNQTMTKNKPISVKPRPFIGLLILDVINQFIFGHGVVIYYLFALVFVLQKTVLEVR